MLPTALNGGIEISAFSATFGVRSSGTASTVSSATANSTAPRLSCAYSARTGDVVVPKSSKTASRTTMKSVSGSLRMSVTRRWRVAYVARTMCVSVYSVRVTVRSSPPIPDNMRRSIASAKGAGQPDSWARPVAPWRAVRRP